MDPNTATSLQDGLVAWLSPLADKSQESILKAVELMEREAPTVVIEILRWHFVISLIWFVIFGAVSITMLAFLRPMWREAKKVGCEEFMSLYFLIMCLFGFFATLQANWFQIWIAPRMFLIEYLTNMVK